MPAEQVKIEVELKIESENLILLSKLPTAEKTAQVKTNHAYFIHGLSIDVIFEVPLYTYSFWKHPAWLLGSSNRAAQLPE